MNVNLRQALNSAIVVFLTLGGIMLTTNLPVDWSPYTWSAERFSESERMAMGFVYRVGVWALVGAVVAFLLLFLKPRKLWLYASVSAATFVLFMQSWGVLASGNLYNIGLELTWIITVPVLYWLFVRIAQ